LDYLIGGKSKALFAHGMKKPENLFVSFDHTEPVKYSAKEAQSRRLGAEAAFKFGLILCKPKVNFLQIKRKN